MALALNIFKTITAVITTQNVGIYTAPIGYTGVVLLAQVSNLSQNSQDVTFSHTRVRAGVAVTTQIQFETPIESKDILNLLSGKLVLESGDIMKISGSVGNGDLKFISSILETLN